MNNQINLCKISLNYQREIQGAIGSYTWINDLCKESEKWCGINIPADTTLCYGFIFLSKSEELAAPRK